MSKPVQIPIEIYVTYRFYEGLIYEWGDKEDEFTSCIFYLSFTQKQVTPIERSMSDVTIIGEFNEWLPRKNHPDPKSDAEVFQRDIYNFFEPGKDVVYTADIYPMEVSSLDTSTQQLDY